MFSQTTVALLLTALSLATAKPIAGVMEDRLVRRTTYSGTATVNPVSDGALGSCGSGLSNSQMFVALSNDFMKSESPAPYCGRKIKVTNTGPDGDNSIGGKGNSVTVTVADTCMGCDQGHLDLSVAAWNKLTNDAAYSHVGIKWEFIS